MQLTATNSSDFSEDKKLLALSLARITFLSFEEKFFLEKNLDSAIDLALMSIDDISLRLKRPITKAVWNGQENLRMAKLALHYCDLLGVKLLHHSDKAYPELLRQIADPPFLLFCRGDVGLLSKRTVSVVGTRQLTPDGKSAAYSFAYDAVNDGCCIVSGLAAGADAFAHRGAVGAYFDAVEKKLPTEQLEKLGRTIAVIPSAIDEIVPNGNKKLAEQILKTGGCIISEYEPRVGMAKWHFVARNRIIAGLSPATVVIEAPAGSGALITADFALEYNRDLAFHQSAFGEMAASVAKRVSTRLQKDYEAKKVSKYKIENTPDKFLEAGAPIIKNYKDYCEYLSEEPGKRINTTEEQLLFNLKEGI